MKPFQILLRRKKSSIPPAFTLTDLSMWIDASVPSRIFQTAGGSLATDGAPVGVIVDAAGTKCLSAQSTGVRPTYSASGANGYGSLVYDGVDDTLLACVYSSGTPGSPLQLSNLFTASAKTLLVAVKVISGTSTPNATIYNNKGIFVDNGQYFGLHAANVDSSTARLWAYNWDGSSKSAPIDVPRNTWMVIAIAHRSGSLMIRRNSGSWATTAAGNTTVVNQGVFLGGAIASPPSQMEVAHAISAGSNTDSEIAGAEAWLMNRLGI